MAWIGSSNSCLRTFISGQLWCSAARWRWRISSAPAAAENPAANQRAVSANLYLPVLAFGNRALARRIGSRHRLSTDVDAGGHGTRDADVRAAGRYVPAPETH